MRIIIADNTQIFVNNLQNILNCLPDYDVVGTYSYADNLGAECKRLNADLVLIRSFIFYQNNAFIASRDVKEQSPQTKVIIMLEADKSALVDEAKFSFADSCISYTASAKEFISTIQKTLAGEHVFPTFTDNKWGPWRATLTDREAETIRLICSNMSYEEMAEELNVSKRTISFHVSNILNKTGHKNLSGLILEATHKGYLFTWRK